MKRGVKSQRSDVFMACFSEFRAVPEGALVTPSPPGLSEQGAKMSPPVMWHTPPWLIRPVYILLPSASLHPHTTNTKGYQARILICIWNAPSYASSSVLSAIWPSPRDFEHHAVLIESVLVWNTHTHTHTAAITHTGDFVANGGRVRDGCQAQRDGQSSITACQRCLFFLSPRLPASLVCFCFRWSFCGKWGKSRKRRLVLLSAPDKLDSRSEQLSHMLVGMKQLNVKA